MFVLAFSCFPSALAAEPGNNSCPGYSEADPLTEGQHRTIHSNGELCLYARVFNADARHWMFFLGLGTNEGETIFTLSLSADGITVGKNFPTVVIYFNFK